MPDGFVMYDEWSPYVPEGVDTHGWTDAQFASFVRAENKRRKSRGDNTRIRSVEATSSW